MELSFKNQESQTRVKKNEKFLNESQREFTFLSWNIGYAGLGKEMDFFYDGGGKVRPSKEQFENYLSGIKKTLKENNKVDFIFLQEVDISSKRSYYVDECYGY